MTELGADWRVLDGVATAWFGTSSLTEGAALAGRIVQISADCAIDIRATGVRVRLVDGAHAAAVSELGLAADPSVLQVVGVVLEASDPAAAQQFWQPVLDYVDEPTGGLVDPLRRDPDLRIRQSGEARPRRGRIHLDVVRPSEVVARVSPGEPSGPYGVRHADPDGNEVDLVPGDPLGDGPGTADWQVVFAAMACYRVDSPEQQVQLAVAAARCADVAEFPLLIDLRPGLVVMDSGKDQADADAHGLDLDFSDLAVALQAAARDLGAIADPAQPRFVQLFLDAAEVPAVRAFWTAALGYVHDRRTGTTDILDPLRLNPELVFQELDASDTERREQRGRLHLELAVPADMLTARVDVAVAAGGRVLEESVDRCRVADPEGNELVVIGRR
ncbi:hypothetical protein GIS00_02900 [Nakamurella sp. YIM 132087]|uniref:Glyoxalase-like domain-containing protein n=1 Tax=Nakamurella alba TaxID=2665158 RepID=A0A7K1FJ30_9ACTN|nr:VOC family protein [Nakamurella alba]MTD12894.1 hypothetical protein [Nakamurella alba]